MSEEPFNELEPPRGCIVLANAVAIIAGIALIGVFLWQAILAFNP
jgi:hypothetical protein